MQLLRSKVSPNVILSKLSNGLRVATLKGNSLFGSVGLYIRAGSRQETLETRGVSHFLQHLAFPVPSASTDPRIAELLSTLRGTSFCSASRESMMYCGSVLHDHLPNVVELLAKGATRFLYTPEEVEMAQKSILFEAEEAKKRPDLSLVDLMYQLSYSTGLGNFLQCNEHNAAIMTPAKLEAFCRNHFTPDKMVLVGTGIHHDVLTELAEKHFHHLSPSQTSSTLLDPSSIFVGGSIRTLIPAPPPSHPNQTEPLTYFSIAVPSVPHTHPDLYALHTLQILMGGGDAFSAGGPGKGMYSRLFTNVLNWYREMESCHAFFEPYSDTSLFGLSGSCQPSFHPTLMNMLAGEFCRMCDFDQVAFERAKTQLKSAMWMNMETQLVRIENIGQQLLFRNEYVEPETILSHINAVSLEDIRRIAKTLMYSPKTSSVCLGQSLNGLPDFDQVLRRIRS